jgi:AraC-like DNA-binding protein
MKLRTQPTLPLRAPKGDGGQTAAKSPSCTALARLPAMVDFLESFHKTTGIRLELAPAFRSPLPYVDRPGTARLSADLTLGGKHVATLVSEPLRVRELSQANPSAGPVGGPSAEGEDRRPNGADGTRLVSADRFRNLQALLRVFARQFSLLANSYFVAGRQDEPAMVRRAREFMDEHLTEEIRLGDVARYAGLSRDHFNRKFGAATGLTCVEYLTRLRVEKAKQLLADENRRVSEVAFACGFGSIPHFNRAFRSTTGVSPSRYRLSLRQAPR